MMSLSSCRKLAVFSELCFFSGKWFPSNGKNLAELYKNFSYFDKNEVEKFKIWFFTAAQCPSFLWGRLADVLKNIVVTNKGMQHFCFSD